MNSVCLCVFITPTKFSRNPFISQRMWVWVRVYFWFYFKFFGQKTKIRTECYVLSVPCHTAPCRPNTPHSNKDVTIEIHLALKSILHRPIIHSGRFQCPGNINRCIRWNVNQNNLRWPQKQNGEPDREKEDREFTQKSQYKICVYIWPIILSSIFQYFEHNIYVCHSMRK